VAVTLSAGAWSATAVVEPEFPSEECHLPELHLPYATLAGASAAIAVRIEAGDALDLATFELPLPNPVRRLGSSGPGRVVMAMVAAARAGGRPLDREDIRFVRERFEREHPLSDAGEAWLRAWIQTLRDADPSRLSPEAVARRLAPHVDAGIAQRIVCWLWQGEPRGWNTAWIRALAVGLGLPPERVEELRSLIGDDAPERRREALAMLGLEEGAAPEEIRTAWRRMVRLNHPDRARDEEARLRATRRTSELNAAYDHLSRVKPG
jgi:DnaJ-domain-containing protein 1